MDRLDTTSRPVWIGDAPTVGFVSPFAGAEFAAMVIAFEKAPLSDKVRLATALIDQGCRYAVCCGIDCDDWETVFDDADVANNPEGNAGQFVMTTSHKGESLEAVAEFLFTCTSIEDSPPERFLVLTVGGQIADRDVLTATVTGVLAALPNPPLQRTVKLPPFGRSRDRR